MGRLVDELEREIPEIRNSILSALGKLPEMSGSEESGERDSSLRAFRS